PLERVGRNRGDHQLAVPLRDRGVAEEGEAGASRDRPRRRQQGSEVPDREDRGNRPPSVFGGNELPMAIHAVGAPSGEVGDGGALWQRDDIGFLQGDQGVALSGGGPEPL